MANGILVIDKSAGWTSQDVAAKLRGVFHERRVGHGGTLDPMATGVLPIFIGRATRAAEFLESAEKEYVAGLRLGVVTDTQDTSGNILETHPVAVTREEVQAALRQFLGPIEQTLGRRDPAQVRVLDIGCGPGIFSVLLAREGFAVTAIDYTPEMLKNARANAGQLARNIDWRFMDAQDLDFADGSFDVVVSRNVTWNLPDPLRAYRSWARVLAGGGVLVNFDASWYAYLFDQDDERRHRTRELVGSVGMDGSRVRTDVDAMERIALQAPLSSADRPVWDAEVLGALGFEVQVDRQVGKRVWTPHEQELFSATPLFKVVATRP